MANEEMIQKHLDNFLAKIAGETPVDDTIQNSTEFWINKIAEQGGGGTEVIANPTLSGTEDDLTSIEIDDTKYKVPKGSYIAVMADSTHISEASYAYINANYLGVPCFVTFGAGLYRVVMKRENRFYSEAYIPYTSSGNSPFIKWCYIDALRAIYEVTRDLPQVLANPSGDATVDLVKLMANGVNYKVRDGATNGLGYLTTAPTAANNDGIKIVVLSSEPATKYNGYLYIILA